MQKDRIWKKICINNYCGGRVMIANDDTKILSKKAKKICI